VRPIAEIRLRRRLEPRPTAHSSIQSPTRCISPTAATLSRQPMKRWRKTLTKSTLPQRMVAGILLVAYAFTCAGFLPLPAFANKKKSDTPFPCQDHFCGCTSAEECWTQCCCFTVEQRWEWAASHAITPPEYAVRPASSHCPDCEKHATTARCESCGDLDDHNCESTQHDKPVPAHGVFTVARCHGLAGEWLGIGVVLPAVFGNCALYDRSITERLLDANFSPVVLRFVPPDPPPRMS
jgi:hypothetical protein